MTNSTWNAWTRSFAEIVSALVLIYKELELNEPHKELLQKWIERNPEDSQAKRMLSDLDNQ